MQAAKTWADNRGKQVPLHRIAFRASTAPAAQEALAQLTALHGQADLQAASVVVALGGDGFMLQTLHDTETTNLPVYGMNCGTIGFLMNTYAVEDLPARLAAAEEAVINPLRMTAVSVDGTVTQALAINEVSLLRQGRQACDRRSASLAGALCWRRPSAD